MDARYRKLLLVLLGREASEMEMRVNFAHWHSNHSAFASLWEKHFKEAA